MPKTSALDHSATLPDVLAGGQKQEKYKNADYLLVLTGSLNQGCSRSKLFKVKSRSELVDAVDLYQEKIHHKILKEKRFMIRQDIEVLQFIVYEIKLKFLLSLRKRVRDTMKTFLGIFFTSR